MFVEAFQSDFYCLFHTAVTYSIKSRTCCKVPPSSMEMELVCSRCVLTAAAMMEITDLSSFYVGELGSVADYFLAPLYI